MVRGRIVAVVLLTTVFGTTDCAVAQCSNGNCGKASGTVISAGTYLPSDLRVAPLGQGYAFQNTSVVQPSQAWPSAVQSIDPQWNNPSWNGFNHAVPPQVNRSYELASPVRQVVASGFQQAPPFDVTSEESVELLYDVPTESIEYASTTQHASTTQQAFTSTSSESLNTLNFVDESFLRDTQRTTAPAARTVAVQSEAQVADLFESPVGTDQDEAEVELVEPVVELPSSSEVVDAAGHPLPVDTIQPSERESQLAAVDTIADETIVEELTADNRDDDGICWVKDNEVEALTVVDSSETDHQVAVVSSERRTRTQTEATVADDFGVLASAPVQVAAKPADTTIRRASRGFGWLPIVPLLFLPLGWLAWKSRQRKQHEAEGRFSACVAHDNEQVAFTEMANLADEIVEDQPVGQPLKQSVARKESTDVNCHSDQTVRVAATESPAQVEAVACKSPSTSLAIESTTKETFVEEPPAIELPTYQSNACMSFVGLTAPAPPRKSRKRPASDWESTEPLSERDSVVTGQYHDDDPRSEKRVLDESKVVVMPRSEVERSRDMNVSEWDATQPNLDVAEQPLDPQLDQQRVGNSDSRESLDSREGRAIESRDSWAVASGDNLTLLQGICPETSDLLIAAGYSDFAKLSQANSEDLRQVFRAAGPRFASVNPDSWPEQAIYALQENWALLARWKRLNQDFCTVSDEQENDLLDEANRMLMDLAATRGRRQPLGKAAWQSTVVGIGTKVQQIR